MASRAKRTTRKHEVRANLRVLELTKLGTSLELELYAAGERLGTLTIGRGSLSWRGGKRKSVKRIAWPAFAQHMDDLAYGPRRG